MDFVASFQVVFSAELASFCDLEIAESADQDLDASFLVSISVVCKTLSFNPAVELLAGLRALSNILVGVNDDFLLGNQLFVGASWV